jgi:hypothetical protein
MVSMAAGSITPAAPKEEEMFVAKTSKGNCYLVTPGTGVVIYIGQPSDLNVLALLQGETTIPTLTVDLLQTFAWSANSPTSKAGIE